jgi:hypothetical protein
MYIYIYIYTLYLQVSFRLGMLLHPNVSPEDGSVSGGTFDSAFGPTKNVTHLAQAIVDLMATPDVGECGVAAGSHGWGAALTG